MKIIRHTARDMRQALRGVREQLGEDAVILSSRRTSEGVEITAAIDFDASTLEAGGFANTPVAPPPIIDATVVAAPSNLPSTSRSSATGTTARAVAASPPAPRLVASPPALRAAASPPVPRAVASLPAPAAVASAPETGRSAAALNPTVLALTTRRAPKADKAAASTFRQEVPEHGFSPGSTASVPSVDCHLADPSAGHGAQVG
ncbi:MAG: hypothetical protein JO042_01070, partial [Sinobacteraceae bacterium]|nr:hypothetical protein [Nevskiaceae bacterium]